MTDAVSRIRNAHFYLTDRPPTEFVAHKNNLLPNWQPDEIFSTAEFVGKKLTCLPPSTKIKGNQNYP